MSGRTHPAYRPYRTREQRSGIERGAHYTREAAVRYAEAISEGRVIEVLKGSRVLARIRKRARRRARR